MDNCRKKKLVGKQKFNLERHLSTVHGMKFAHKAPVLPNKEIVLKIKMDPALVYKAYVENLAVDGRPIAFVNDGGMRKLVNPILEAFEKSNVHLNVSIPSVKAYMVKYTAAVKNEIKEEVKNRIVHIKLDIASRNRRSILGINVQFSKDDKITVRTLGMVPTNRRHTGEYICTLLTQTLDEYNIDYSQVHTITTDNGKNVLKTVKFFEAIGEADLNESDDLALDFFFGEEINNTEEDNEEDDDEDDEEVIDQIELNLNAAVSMLHAKTRIMNGIRCAAHTTYIAIGGQWSIEKKTTLASW